VTSTRRGVQQKVTPETHPSDKACGAGGWIREERMARRKPTGARWSMRLLAELAGMNQDTVNNYEKAKTKPLEIYLDKLRGVFTEYPRAIIRD